MKPAPITAILVGGTTAGYPATAPANRPPRPGPGDPCGAAGLGNRQEVMIFPVPEPAAAPVADVPGDPRVLRLASVFPVPDFLLGRVAAYDPVGGMQNHTGQLSAELDRLGVRQTVVTAYRPGAPREEPLGTRGRGLRVG